jgi:16S rRNA (guanine527-N7)-methyltransferase
MSDLVDGRFWRLGKWFPELTPVQLEKLQIYHAELIKFNGRINLISPRSERTADLFHFADCILGARAVLKRTAKKEIYDLGSGNGLPGIVFGVLAPDRQMVLVDADARKVEFLKHIATRLNLSNVRTINGRLEDIAEGSIHAAVSRGLASISKALLMARKASAVGCEFYHFKGETWPNEVAEMPSQILAHWEPKEIDNYDLPEGSVTLTVVQTRRKK